MGRHSFPQVQVFSPPLLKMVGDSISQLLVVDAISYQKTDTEVAQICVEMDMDFDLPE